MPSTVYLLYDYEGTLLYIGNTVNPLTRPRHHSRKLWGHEIDWARTVLAECPQGGAQLERQLIRALTPKYNKVWHSDWHNNKAYWHQIHGRGSTLEAGAA